MRRRLFVWFAVVCALSGACAETETDAEAAGEWRPGEYVPWSRYKTHRFSIRADGVPELRHAGSGDWTLDAFVRLSVKPGEAYTFSCRSERASDAEISKPFRLCAALYDAHGRLLTASWGAKEFSPGATGETTFLIPYGAAFVQPRFAGQGEFAGAFPLAKFRRATGMERVTPESELVPRVAISSSTLDVSFTTTNGVFAVTDRRTGRTWASTPNAASARRTIVIQSACRARMFAVRLVDGESLLRYTVVCRLAADAPEFTVTVSADPESALPGETPLAFPPPFASRPGDRLILPRGEGLGVPVDSKIALGPLAAFAGRDLSMAFFGVVSDAVGDGWVAILETPDDAYVLPARLGDAQLWSAGPGWVGSRGRFGAPRTVRYAFVTEGGPVALAKRYRAYVRAQGRFVTLREKAARRPAVARLPGAANICYLPARGEKSVSEMAAAVAAAGIDRTIWTHVTAPSAVRALAADASRLVGCYDGYRDVYHPEQLRRLGWTHGPNEKAWPSDINWRTPAGVWRRGSAVASRTGEMTHCAMMCDAEAPKHARARLAAAREMRPYTARTLEALFAEPWQECAHPNHPLTRTASREARLALLEVLAEENLAVGVEYGHDAAAGACDYFEGMLSFTEWCMPPGDNAAAFRQGETPEQVPPEQLAAVALRALAPELRLPLWELVYHECGVVFWHVQDASNWPLSLWRRRDLFNALYGTSGTFAFDGALWDRAQKRFAASYRLWGGAARRTAFSEMTDFRCLTLDRLVQCTVFAEGTVVIANFGETPYTLPNGLTIPPQDVRVLQKRRRPRDA